MFQQIKVRHISEEIFDQIRSAIVEGKLKPGEKLPTERELMQEMGVSRVPIREALKLLATMGFVETKQGGGSYVRSLVTDRVRDPLNQIIKDNLHKIFELLEVRKEIETWSAYRAAQRASADDITTLGQIMDKTKVYFDKKKTPPTELDADFHLAIAQCSSNTIQAHLAYTIYEIFKEYFDFLTKNICFNKKYQQAIYDQHFAIYDAVRRRRPQDAKKRMMEHLTFVDGELKRQTGKATGKAARKTGTR